MGGVGVCMTNFSVISDDTRLAACLLLSILAASPVLPAADSKCTFLANLDVYINAFAMRT